MFPGQHKLGGDRTFREISRSLQGHALKKKNKIPVPSPTHSHTLDEQFVFSQCFPRCVSSPQAYQQQGQPAIGQILYKWEAKYSFSDYMIISGDLGLCYIYLFAYLFGGHVRACTSQYTHGGQRRACGNWFSPSTVWVSGISSKPSGLAETAFTHSPPLKVSVEGK